VEKKLQRLFNRDFYSKDDGLKTLHRMEKAWKFHKVKEIGVVEKRNESSGMGRPKNGETYSAFTI